MSDGDDMRGAPHGDGRQTYPCHLIIYVITDKNLLFEVGRMITAIGRIQSYRLVIIALLCRPSIR